MTIRPRIIWSGSQWMCWSPAIFGSRIVGCGKTLKAAYEDWKEKAKE